MRSDLDDVDVVFLAWREPPGLLERQHAAVAAALRPHWRGRAVLVENGAAPATAAAARAQLARYPHAEPTVLWSRRNLGFARAVDLGLDACRGRYAALLNSDGRPDPDMLRVLAAELDADPSAVAAAPGVHGPGEESPPAGPAHPVEQLSGTAVLLRRAEFLAAGGFDPLYFFYNEDADASRRLRAAGHVLLRVPATRFTHDRSGRSAAGVFLREWHHARTAQVLVHQYAPSLPRELPRFAVRRARAVAAHLRDGDRPGAAGIALATLELPRGLLAAAARRRRPWDGDRLAAWLRTARPRCGPVQGPAPSLRGVGGTGSFFSRRPPAGRGPRP
ncbi:Glycosyltransferase, GT2 family [Geodermatophilus pulveris]|uniref:Glycosyltransferase, GT2 family n=1 Tax=Geodermatophilus pulveris TaxID=1564159 RepID=A0A239HK17_9ACTN|nr:glycosyltransferase [Geodermatophilus pulveris]SNS81163.1 Glycosyltransferase, GT2 family [Geodermatophilus pulveris]